jgi:hypothetical protein
MGDMMHFMGSFHDERLDGKGQASFYSRGPGLKPRP